MSFANNQYFFFAIGVIVIISLLLNRLNSSFFKWVKSYWFFERTWSSKISSFFYLLSLFLFMLSLLDLRGPEKKVRANLPDQRTIIMLDTSSSMLSEDVRPSRFAKSIQIARHFVKSAAGHQISIVLFSDIQKRLIPFTDDIDLIDSRLAALEKMNSVAGGSNISQAIEESIQYFDFDSNEDDKTKSGNLLVFTDAEESEGEFKVHIPLNVNLAMIGVGTLKGGNIPLRYEDGAFKGYKTFKGEQVVTKLDEDYLKKIGKGVKNYKYWIVNSYSLPTDEIKNFFREGYTKKQGMGDLRIRPVYSHYILIPAILLYCFSVIIGRMALFKVAKVVSLFIFIFLGLQNLQAEDKNESKERPLSPEIIKDLETIQKGKGSREFVLKVAEKLLKEHQGKKATELYSEYAKKNDSEEVRFNYATSLLKSNRLQEALPLVQEIIKDSKNEELKDKLRNNVLLAMDPNKKQEQQDKKKEEKKDDKDKKDDKKQDQKDQQGNKENKDSKDNKDPKNQSPKPGESNKDGNKKPQDSKENKSPDKQDNEKKGTEDKDKESKEEKNKKESSKEEKDNQQKEGPKTLDEKEKEIEQKRKMVKTPAMIKQIMSDDRELQKKLMDTSTNQLGEQKPKRDW